MSIIRCNLDNVFTFQVLTSVCAVISEVAIDYQNVGIISDYDVVPLLAELTNVVGAVLLSFSRIFQQRLV